MKPKTKKPLSPAKSIQREIAALNKEERNTIAAAVKAEVREERAAAANLTRLEKQLAGLKRAWAAWSRTHESATNRRLQQLDRRRNILEARLSAL
jgi:hypothetical protein